MILVLRAKEASLGPAVGCILYIYKLRGRWDREEPNASHWVHKVGSASSHGCEVSTEKRNGSVAEAICRLAGYFYDGMYLV